MKLTKRQAFTMVAQARALQARSGNSMLRLGQILGNQLDIPEYSQLVGTKEDFYYDKEESVALEKFYRNCVDNEVTYAS